jgi:putative transcriptional regulator
MRAAALLATLVLAAAPPAVREPAIGRLLIARSQVVGFFAESVIVLVDHGPHGSLGLIVNRPLELSVDELLPELPAARGHAEPAYLGGPVAQGQLLLLVRASEPPPGSALVVEGVHVSGSRETLGALLVAPGPGVELRAYVGYAGWAPGQLDAEIARGDWLLAPADAAAVFTRAPERLWQELLRRHEAIRVQAPRNGARSEPTRDEASREASGVTTTGRPARLAASGASVAAPAKSITLSAPWRSAAASSACRTSARARSSTP